MEPFSNEQIEFAESNAEALVFPDASFDRVLGNLCLMIVPSPESAIQECRRVLTDKGIAVFSVWGRPEYSSMFTIHVIFCHISKEQRWQIYITIGSQY